MRDAHLTEASAADMEKWRHLDMPYSEVKVEVSIDRLTSQANPRNFERVPAGAAFAFEVLFDTFEADNEAEFLQVLRDGFELLANDSLGGQGSRGYGAVKVQLESIDRLDIGTMRDGGEAQWAAVAEAPGFGALPWLRPEETV